MRIRFFLPTLIILLFGYENSRAQQPDYTLSFSGAANSSVKLGTISAHKELFSFLNRKVRLGLGVRLNMYKGSNINYFTADPDLKSDDANKDTFFVESATIFSPSLFFNGEYAFHKKWLAGLSIDLIGYSFGSEVRGDYFPAANAQKEGKQPTTQDKAIPTEKNILLVGSPVFGNLNSQLYIRFEPNERISIVGGFTWYMAEYSSREPIGVAGNDRFRRAAAMPFIGISFNRFNTN